MVTPSQVPTSPRARSRQGWIERELDVMSPGQRRFFELVIGLARALFVPVWLVLYAGWAGRRLILGRTNRPVPPPPGPEWLETSMYGYALYLAGAYLAVVIGLLSMIGLCFLPVLTIFWVVAALEQEGPARAVAGAVGAAGLEALMLFVYFRYMRGVLARP